MITRSCEKS